ncbi:hypothetical protein [Aliidiomarina sp.]|uniref:hypothetical protein n=1 Tax=Aliidiomarina sp. TaxID=1872439 RepID=UPI003A4E00F5
MHSLAIGQASAARHIDQNLAEDANAITERIPVYVAAYEFPPYYSSRLPHHFLGELIKALNARQVTYHFSIREVPPQERYSAISKNGCCDVIFFESETWRWSSEHEYTASAPLMHGADRMYSLQNDNWLPTDEDRVGGVVGYHYNYTQFDIDAGTSEQEFMMYRADSQLTLLNMLRNNRIQFAMFTDEFVHWLAVQNPELIEDLYAAPEADTVYTTQVLVGANSSIEFVELMELVNELFAEPEVIAALKYYGLQRLEQEHQVHAEGYTEQQQ